MKNIFVDSELTLSGSLLTEDYFDNMDDSQITSSVSGISIEDSKTRLSFTTRVQTICFGWSIKRQGNVLEKILRASSIFTNVKVCACELNDLEKKKDVVEIQRPDFPDDKEYIVNAYLGEYRPNDLKCEVTYDVAFTVSKKMTYVKFYTELARLRQTLSLKMPMHTNNLMLMVIYNTDKPDRISEINIGNGNTDDTDVKVAYKILYEREPEVEFDNHSLIKKIPIIDMVRQFVQNYNSETNGVYTINVSESINWLTKVVGVISIEFISKNIIDEKNQTDVGFIMELIKLWIVPAIPDIALDEYILVLSVRSNVKINGLNNKRMTIHGDNGRISWATVFSNMNSVRPWPVKLAKKTESGQSYINYETNRFIDLRIMRNNMTLYVIFPLTNGYIVKDIDNVKCIDSNLETIIKNPL